MYRVVEFKKALETIRAASDVVSWTVGVLGISFLFWSVVEYGWTDEVILGTIVSLLAFYGYYVLKVFSYGIAFTLIQIAENTAGEDDGF